MPEGCNPNECPYQHRIEALEEANRNYDRINESVINRISNLETENAVQNAHYEAISTKLDELTIMVRELKDKPTKRWDGLVDKAIWAIAAAVIAFLLAKIGL